MRALLSQLGRAMPAGLILRAGIGSGGGGGGSCGDGGREMGRRCSFDDVGRWGRRRGVKVGRCGIYGR